MISQKEYSFALGFKEIEADLLRRLIARSVDVPDAEDILQKAALKMWKKYDSFTEGTSFKAWAWIVTLNTMRNFLRAKKRSVVRYGEEIPEKLSDGAAHINPDDPRLPYLEEVLGRLSSSETKIIQAVYIEGKKIKEYAEENNISKQTCFNTISLLRKKLKTLINERILLEMY
jgi:RNA polymerase sigma-70 factor (ECF subfamily)